LEEESHAVELSGHGLSSVDRLLGVFLDLVHENKEAIFLLHK
jgi:hypothetical protein